MQLMPHYTTPKKAGAVIARLLTSDAGATASGVYYDEDGKPMFGSTQVHDPAFQDRVVAETRALLATVGS
jgi:hypothetical protein